MLHVGRIVTEIGEVTTSTFLTKLTAFIVEITPERLRGQVGGIIQLFAISGVTLGYASILFGI